MAQKNFNDNLEMVGTFLDIIRMKGYDATFDGSTNNVVADGLDVSTLEQYWNETVSLLPDINRIADYTDGGTPLIFHPFYHFTPVGATPMSEEEKSKDIERRLVELFDRIRKYIITADGHTESEAIGWGDKVLIAERIVASTASAEETAEMQVEVDARDVTDETVTTLAVKVLANAAMFRVKRNKIDGTYKRLNTQLEPSPTNVTEIIFNAVKDLTSQLDQ